MNCDTLREMFNDFRCCAACHEHSNGVVITINYTDLTVCCAAARALDGEPEECPSSEEGWYQ